MLSAMEHLKHLPKLRGKYDQLALKAYAARLELADCIRFAAADGARQVDIVKATGYTREQIRRIVAGRTR